MKRIFSNFFMFSLLVSMIAFTSCNSDDDPILGNPTVTPPSISLTPGDKLISGDAEIEVGEDINIKLSLFKGDNSLRSFSIMEDGTNVAANRMIIDGGAVTSQNPFLLVGGAADGADYDITITTDAGIDEARIYTIEVEDEANETASVQFQVRVVFVGTPLDEELTAKLLLNQGGGAGQGGLNLFTGEGTGTVGSDASSADAHIKDEGIDLDKVAAENWIQRISGINGSEIRIPGAGNVEGFSYETVATKEEIVEAFSAADELTETNSDGELVTPIVNIDDVFLVKNGENYWLLKVTNVNVTDSNNDDSYEFSIKQ